MTAASERCRRLRGRRLLGWVADFKNLMVWQKAQRLAVETHRVSRRIRRSDVLVFRNQMVRAAFSIPTNIAEGRSADSEREFCRFLRIALNSSTELEYHLITCRDVGALEHEVAPLLSQTIEVRKMLYGLIGAVQKASSP